MFDNNLEGTVFVVENLCNDLRVIFEATKGTIFDHGSIRKSENFAYVHRIIRSSILTVAHNCICSPSCDLIDNTPSVPCNEWGLCRVELENPDPLTFQHQVWWATKFHKYGANFLHKIPQKNFGIIVVLIKGRALATHFSSNFTVSKDTKTQTNLQNFSSSELY